MAFNPLIIIWKFMEVCGSSASFKASNMKEDFESILFSGS
jgi:hypothetical protein